MKKTRMTNEYLDVTLNIKESKKLLDRLGMNKELAYLIKMHMEVNESFNENEMHAL